MTFLNIIFPEDISYGAKGGPEFSTYAAVLKNKQESRNSNWLFPRYKFFINYGLKSKIQIDSLIDSFHICQGRAKSFKYKDWNDYSVKNQLIATADGVSNKFQLIKTYSFGEFASKRYITKPLKSTLVVKVNNQIYNSSLYNLDETTGILTFSNILANGLVISADFEFFIPMRFDVDYLEISSNQINNFSTQIPLIEVFE